MCFFEKLLKESVAVNLQVSAVSLGICISHRVTDSSLRCAREDTSTLRLGARRFCTRSIAEWF